MTTPSSRIAAAVPAATACAFAMITCQVAGKAVRDALFLSSFGIDALPGMIAGASILTILAVFLASRALVKLGPGRLVPAAFGLSGVALLGIAWLAQSSARAAALGLYLQMAAFGSVLISWFWSLVSERLDPRTARRRIGGIASGGTLGGLLGGILAERVGATLGLNSMLPLLALLHFAGAVLAWSFIRGTTEPPRAAAGSRSSRSGLRVLAETPYLRDLALLVTSGTLAATFLDFVFKERAANAFEGEELLRFFGLFYTGVALLTFLVQSLLTRRLLQVGLAPTAAALPMLTAVGGIAALLLPGLPVTAIARGTENSARSSLFRSAYELFYSPLREADKRAAKTIVDVGFDRLGDAFAAGLVQLVLWSAFPDASAVLLLGAVLMSTLGIWLARRLHVGYIGKLEERLLEGEARLDLVRDPQATQEVLQTLAHLELSSVVPTLSSDDTTPTAPLEPSASRPPSHSERTPAEPTPPSPAAASGDELSRAFASLRSFDAERVQATLAAHRPLPPELVPVAVPLLGWDQVAAPVVEALREVAPAHTGQLLDALRAEDQAFAVRRRLPRILAAAPSQRCAEGLVPSLQDRRFEVRYQAGVALARIMERDAGIRFDREAILGVVLKEASVGRRVWESNRLLDAQVTGELSPFHDRAIRDRTSRSLEHVFTVLALVLPRAPLRVAFRGIHTTDPTLRGTALEYLENVLPTEVREVLWPYLPTDAEIATSAASARNLDEIVHDLMESHASIFTDLDDTGEKEARDRKQGDA